ncbi:hypothetical protein GCM10010519_11190 [Streptomyces lactacystinicus]
MLRDGPGLLRPGGDLHLAEGSGYAGRSQRPLVVAAPVREQVTEGSALRRRQPAQVRLELRLPGPAFAWRSVEVVPSPVPLRTGAHCISARAFLPSGRSTAT